MKRSLIVLVAAALVAASGLPVQPALARALRPPAPPSPSVASANTASIRTSPLHVSASRRSNRPAVASALPISAAWTLQNPQPSGDPLFAISCPTTNSCFAAGGANSQILASGNGGASWSQQAKPTATINAISCVSAAACVSVGDSGLVMTTTNGGLTWSSETVNNGNFLSGVSCPLATTCFAVGAAGSVLFSSNGGVTWVNQSSTTTANLFGVSCPSTTVCFADGAGGVITATSSGGALWSTEASGTQAVLIGISCPTASSCDAVGQFQASISTTTGGASWSNYVGPAGTPTLYSVSCPSSINQCFAAGLDGLVHVGLPVPYSSTSVGADGSLYGISCPSPTECLTTGDYGTIAVTTNGGSGWSTKASGLSSVGGISCPSATECFAIDNQTVLETTDGGTTWPAVLTSAATSFNSISCPTTNTCYAAGQSFGPNDPMIDVTNNGGSTWTGELLPAFTGDRIDSISCPTATTCAAVDYGSTVTSTSDGVHWFNGGFGPCTGTCPGLTQISCPSTSVCYVATTADPAQIYVGGLGTGWTLSFDESQDPQGGPGSLTSITCPSTSVCYAAGSGSGFLASSSVFGITTNGGSTWRSSSGPGFTNPASISCPSASTCYVAGSSILHSSDYGSTWDAQFIGTSFYSQLFAMACVSTAQCFAGGGAGVIVGTSSAGASWSRPEPAGATALISGGGLSCPDTSDCYAVGFEDILASHDAGSTWSVQHLATGDLLQSLSCPSASTCYAVGWPGAIYRTVDSGATWTYESNPQSGFDRSLIGVGCWSANGCVAVGTGGLVLSTTDGTTWTPEPTPTFQNLFAVSCPSIGVCVAVTDSGGSLTRSGGTWSFHAAGTSNFLGGVGCAPATSFCYAVGQSGTVLLSTNTGATWTAQSSGTASDLYGISCLRVNFCIADGNLGAAIITQDGVHWTRLAVPTADALRAAAIVDLNHAWLAGLGGTVLANLALTPACGTAGLTPSVTSPELVGASITFTAASGGCSIPRYQFWVLPPGGSWSVVQAFSSSNVFHWNTAGLNPGTYQVVAWANQNGDPMAGFESFGQVTMTLNGCGSAALSAAPPSPQTAGTQVVLTASSTVCPNPQYEFWMLAPGAATWQDVRPFSSTATFAWSTSGKVAGAYSFIVWAKDSASGGAAGNSLGRWDTYVSTRYTIRTSACTGLTPSAAPPSPSTSGVSIAITGTASGCADSSPLYEFWMLAPGGAWQNVQPYGTTTSYPWSTRGLLQGTYTFSIWVRDSGSAGTSGDSLGRWDVYSSLSYALDPAPCASVSVSASPPSPSTRGTTVQLTATGSGCADPLFEFWMLAPGSNTWQLMQGYSSNGILTWKTTSGMAPGLYHFSVWARDASSKGTSGDSLGRWDAITAPNYRLT